MLKRRAYREIPDQELSEALDETIRASIDAAERDIEERRRHGSVRPAVSGGTSAGDARAAAERIGPKGARRHSASRESAE